MAEKKDGRGRPGRFDNDEDRRSWYREYAHGYYLLKTKRKRQEWRRLRAKERLLKEA